jgi:FlaA1/EpsC-like NDP-sugar epimerase
MIKQKKIHFEISERKILLRIFDILCVLLALYAIGKMFRFDYFNISTTNFYWTIVLALYISVIGSVFEMYNLQVASNQFQIIKSTDLLIDANIYAGIAIKPSANLVFLSRGFRFALYLAHVVCQVFCVEPICQKGHPDMRLRTAPGIGDRA